MFFLTRCSLTYLLLLATFPVSSSEIIVQFCSDLINLSQLCSYAGALFADACLKGLNGVPDVVECSFVQSTVTELPFFASKVKFTVVC